MELNLCACRFPLSLKILCLLRKTYHSVLISVTSVKQKVRWVHLSHTDGQLPAHSGCLNTGSIHSGLCFLFFNAPLKPIPSEFHQHHSLVYLLLKYLLIFFFVLPSSTASPQIPPDLLFFMTRTQLVTFSCLNDFIPRHYTSGSTFSLPFAGCFQFHWLLKIGMP